MMKLIYGEHKLTRYRGESVGLSYNLRPKRGHGPVEVTHPGFLEIELLDEGSHLIRLDGRVHEARSGDATVVTPGCVHSWWTELSTARGYTVHIPVRAVEAVCAQSGIRFEQWPSRVWSCSDEMKPILALMRSAADSEVAVLRDLLLGQLANTLVVATCRALFPGVEPGSAPILVPSEQRLDDLADRLRDEPERDWTLDQMARLAGMSKFHFCRQFKTRFRMTPRQFLLRRRLDLAKTTLTQGESNLTHVALAAGFGSSSQFSKDFKRSFGVSPSVWSKKRLVQ